MATAIAIAMTVTMTMTRTPIMIMVMVMVGQNSLERTKFATCIGLEINAHKLAKCK